LPSKNDSRLAGGLISEISDPVITLFSKDCEHEIQPTEILGTAFQVL
jgi:hypothetical protein